MSTTPGLRGALLLAALAAACQRAPSDVEATPDGGTGFHFVDVAAEAGLTRVLHAGRPGKDHLLDSAGTGAAWLDYDRDGFLDIYLVNGWEVDGSRVVERGTNALYRNRGDGTFEDVTEAAGVGGEGHWGSGVAVADHDADGWPDILVTNFGPNVLYRNGGDGTFENVAPRLGIEVPGWNTGAAWFDADGDGDLDLYVAAYIDCSIEEVLAAERTLDWKGVDRVALGPFGLPGAPDHFFRNSAIGGDGRFEDATAAAGLDDLSLGFGFSVLATDLDGDGDTDLYVANDSDANYMYRNEGDGTFREVGMWTGTAFDALGAAQAGMGIAAGDADGNGLLDIFVTNFAQDFSTLYKGDGTGFFEDASAVSGVGPATYDALSWGGALLDLDNDGDQDLVVANGHIYPQVDGHPEIGMSYRQQDLLLENDGHGLFTDATVAAGPGFAIVRSSRGLAAGDYDNDGDLDLLVTALDSSPALLRNDSAGGAWLTVEPRTATGGGPPIGTRVVARVGDRLWVREVASSSSYLSVHDPRLHFGLGAARSVDQLEIHWPDGSRTDLHDVPVDQLLVVEQPD